MATDDLTDPGRLQELIRRCEISRQTRRASAAELRQWYDHGAVGGPTARYNKLRAHLDRVASFLFAPDSVRFGVHLPPPARAAWQAAAEVGRDEFRLRWGDSGADLVTALLIEWALVYGSTVAKAQADPETGFRAGYIDPWDFGVAREDVSSLDDQDHLCHWYVLSLPQVERWAQGRPDRDALLAVAQRYARAPSPRQISSPLTVSSIQGVFPSGTIQGVIGGTLSETPAADVIPQVDEPVLPLVDLWERRLLRRKTPAGEDEVYEDWIVTTLIENTSELLAQRRNPDLPWTRTSADTILPAELPFVVVAPRPLPDSLWGRPELGGLISLQQWRDDHMEKLKALIDLHLKPPKFFSGVPDAEEAGRALDTPGGSYGSADPSAKMEPIIPQIGQEAFLLVRLIDDMFADASGVPEILTGGVPPNVRAGVQATTIAGIGAGRIRRMALVVENAIGLLATRMFHLLQRHDQTAYPLPDGREFLLVQLPPGVTLRVSAHSASPVYAEQTQAKAVALLRAGAIELEDYVELLDPPNRDELKLKARKLAQRRAELAERTLTIEEERVKVGLAPRKRMLRGAR